MAVEKHWPDHIVPEIEVIDTGMLATLEAEGWHVVPSAKAVQLTMNRDGIRDFAAKELGLTTSAYVFATSREEALRQATASASCVVKPVMSSGNECRPGRSRLRRAWDYAVANMRGDRARVIVEQFIAFDSEIRRFSPSRPGHIHCEPVGHRQDAGDYRESWQPAALPATATKSAQDQAAKVVTALGGNGLFGVEFFIAGDAAIFSECRPAPTTPAWSP